MKKYLYYRLYITKFCRSGAQQNYASIAEFALYDVNGVNLARQSGCTYNQNSIGENKPASYAFDGNASTFWHASYSPGSAINWIYVKLPEAETAIKCGIIPRSDSWNDFPYDFEVQGSDDAVTWETLLSEENHSSWTKNVETQFDLNIPSIGAFLIESEGTFYTVTDGVLAELTDVTELTKLVFETYGFAELPQWSVYSELVDPVVHQWSSEEVQVMTATETAIPPLQVLVSPDYDMTDETILGIENVEAEASNDVTFAVSFDEGTTWKMYDGTQWIVLTQSSSGMSASTLNGITTEQWNSVAITGKIKFRIAIPDETETFTSLVVNYIN